MKNFAVHGDVDPKASETADFLLFINKLFDSLNGNTLNHPSVTCKYRCAVTPDSIHWPFWEEAIDVLNSISFVDRKTKKLSVPPSV